MVEKITSISREAAFNPNDVKYKACCCCHTKTVTIVIGILEIFTICFILVAVLPDLNSRICDVISDRNLTNEDSEDFEEFNMDASDIRSVAYIHNLICRFNTIFLFWSISQIIVINLMFYGIKTILYYLFIPHLLFRFACVALLASFETWVIYVIMGRQDNIGPYITTAVFLTIMVLFWLYATWVEIRCAHFIKRSKETGFSISVARPIGPATISLSDRDAPQPVPARQLPPLRNPRNQYIVGDTGNTAAVRKVED